MLKIKRLHKDAVIPKYQTMWASGFDLHAIYDENIPPLSGSIIATGLAFEIPRGYEVQIRPRSGLSIEHPSYIANTPGTIDSDYRGEIKIIVYNHLPYGWSISKGERIAQAVLARVYQTEFKVVDDLVESARGTGGFGSTGNG